MLGRITEKVPTKYTDVGIEEVHFSHKHSSLINTSQLSGH